MNTSTPLALFASCLALAATPAIAETGPTATPSSESNPTIELSPFVVSTDKDNGYGATETLAGTRMRTNLKDIGASLTVLTPEFLRDLGVNSFDQALLYTPSVDSVEGDNTDLNRASGSQLRYGTGQAYSIRGFNTNAGNQSISHDFFNALEPTDNYNTERTTLALGPNALLIGVGNPQGTAVTTTKRALLQRQKTTVQLQTDSNGSSRVAIDYNQPLLKNKLALRLNLLHDQAREFRKYEGKNQERLSLSLTAKPFANTTITLNHENYSLGTNASSLMWGFDSGMIRWLAAGKPTLEFQPAGLAWSSTRPYLDASGKPVPVVAGGTSTDGFIHATAGFSPTGALFQTTGNQQTWVVGLNLPNPMVNERFQGNQQASSFGGGASSNFQSQDPWTLLGISKKTNLNGGTWKNPSNRQHGDWTQLVVEQKLATGLYLELGANIADYHQLLDPANFAQISLDINRYLPDGSVNPGYLVPYDDNGGLQFRPIHNKSNEYRSTLSYELDLTKKNRWLGSHNFAGLFQSSETDNSQDLLRVINLATIGLPTTGGWSGNALDATNTLRSRVYFANGNVPTMPDTSQIMDNLARLNGYGKLAGATANEQAPINLSLQPFLGAIRSKFHDDSTSLGWQARWLDNRLITVMGYRKDDTKSYGAAALRNQVVPGIPGSATDPLKQLYAPGESLTYSSTPTIVANGISRTYGAVLHALPWLSLTYNQSTNFLPVGNASWVDALGRPAPNSTGKTHEYGVRFSLLQGKLSVGFTKFETGADNQARNANASVGPTRNVLTRLRTYKTAGDSHFQALADAGGYFVDTGNVSDTWSYKANGYEMNIVYNPSRNWRTALSGSINTNVLGTHLQALGQYLATDSQYQGLGTWRKLASELSKVAAGQKSSFFDLDPANSANVTLAAADALYLNTQADTQELNYKNDQLTTGITTARNGKYALNALVTRSFSEGRLKGWSVGGNARWRSANTIGYQSYLNATTGLPNYLNDLSKPLKGKEYWDVGAMVSYQRRLAGNVNLRTQLNIQNLPNWQSSRLVKSDYDSQGYYGKTNAIVPLLWELRRPRNFVLTATFEY